MEGPLSTSVSVYFRFKAFYAHSLRSEHVFVKIIKKHTQEIVMILLFSTQDRGVTLGLRTHASKVGCGFGLWAMRPHGGDEEYNMKYGESGQWPR